MDTSFVIASHHAYIVFGDPVGALSFLQSVIRDTWSLSLVGNPNVRILKIDTLGVDDARMLRDDASRTKWGNGRKVVIVSAFYITLEAQNALLKTLEEPLPETYFFLITENESHIVPTLLSRCLVLRPNAELLYASCLKNNAYDHQTDGKAFMVASKKDRLETIAYLFPTEHAREEARPRARQFINMLEMVLAAYLSKSSRDVQVRKSLHEVYACRAYIEDQSPSFRLLLEHLALAIPRF